MKTARTLALFTLLVLATASVLTARTWKEAGSDRTLDGDFVKVEGDTVLIRRANGSTITLPLAKLSEEDQAFAKAQPAAPAPGATTEEAPADGITLSGVHLCCGGCETGVENALEGIGDIEFDMSRTAKTITIKGSGTGKALEALGKKGYYGTSSSETLMIPVIDAPEEKTESVAVTGAHLCCGSCIKAVDKAMATVEGFESHTAQKKAPAFTVKGKDITAAAVLEALHAAGLSAIVR